MGEPVSRYRPIQDANNVITTTVFVTSLLLLAVTAGTLLVRRATGAHVEPLNWMNMFTVGICLSAAVSQVRYLPILPLLDRMRPKLLNAAAALALCVLVALWMPEQSPWNFVPLALPLIFEWSIAQRSPSA